MRPAAELLTHPNSHGAALTQEPTHYDSDAGLVVVERCVTVKSAGRKVAEAVVIERTCFPARHYRLPLLIRFSAFFDEHFAARISALYDVRRGRGPEAGDFEAVRLVAIQGAERRGEIRPPFVIEGSRQAATFLLTELKEAD